MSKVLAALIAMFALAEDLAPSRSGFDARRN